MKRFLLAAALGAALASPTALAAPKAQNMVECMLYADLAATARAMVESKVDRATVDDVISRLYVAGSDNAREIMRAIVDAAFMEGAPPPKDFSELLGKTCLRFKGDMSAVLGVRL